MTTEGKSWQLLEEQLLNCRACPRLVEWRETIAAQKRRAYREQEYWGRPVPGFGDRHAAVLVVGLAPGAHGSNRTGRMFTGDASGDFLYPALYRAGFANQPVATARDDGLALKGLFISAICRCAPPGNKPALAEIETCLPYLEREIDLLAPQGIVCLGRLAFDWVLKIYRSRGAEIPARPFEHAGLYDLGAQAPWLVASYHPSRQNTQTGRLTANMFDQVWQLVRRLCDAPAP